METAGTGDDASIAGDAQPRNAALSPPLPFPSPTPPLPPRSHQIDSDHPHPCTSQVKSTRAPKSRPAPSRVMHESKKHIKTAPTLPSTAVDSPHSSTHSVDPHAQPPIPGTMPARPLTGPTTCIRPICRILFANKTHDDDDATSRNQQRSDRIYIVPSGRPGDWTAETATATRELRVASILFTCNQCILSRHLLPYHCKGGRGGEGGGSIGRPSRLIEPAGG